MTIRVSEQNLSQNGASKIIVIIDAEEDVVGKKSG